MDDFRIYDVVLTQNQINDLYYGKIKTKFEKDISFKSVYGCYTRKGNYED